LLTKDLRATVAIAQPSRLQVPVADGWSVGSSPDITANWIASGEKWTVPVGGGLSKTTRLGGQSVKLAVDGYYNAIRPNSDGPWVLKSTLTFLFPE
jgi:hypothetical protein